MLLKFQNLSKSFGVQILFSNFNYVINEGEKIGIVGANGTGKSTLLKMIAQKEDIEEGNIMYSPNIEIRFFEQTIPKFEGKTIEDLIYEAVGELKKIELSMKDLEHKMSDNTASNLTELMIEYGDLLEMYEKKGGYELDYRIDEIFSALNLSHIDKFRDVATLSGGEKTRSYLAMLLLMQPDILLLDEPTNHLDLQTVEWLEGYIKKCKFSVLLVSHDRQFLNRTVSKILEIDEFTHKIDEFNGNYDFYKVEKIKNLDRWKLRYIKQQEEIKELKDKIRTTSHQVGHNKSRSDNEKFGFNAKGDNVQRTISRNVKAAEEQLKRISDDPIPRPPEELIINSEISMDNKLVGTIFRLTEVSKSYNYMVLDAVDLTVKSGDRILITGENGAGKSTIFKLFAKEEKPNSGTVYINESASIGYLPQEFGVFKEGQTLLDYFSMNVIGHEQELINELMRYGFFKFEDIKKTVSILSIGQRRKLQLATLIAKKPNVLLLDEPTNHISLDIIEGFERAINDFEGAILIISHDRYFVNNFRGIILELKKGNLIKIKD